MTSTSAFGWSWFRREIQESVAFSERHAGGFLNLVEEVDALLGSILARPTSPLSDRPQDYVVSILVTRAFRLTISSLYIGFGGYPDSGTNLERTIWEIGIRLLDMTAAPAAAALGFLLDGAASEIAQIEAELAHRQVNGQPVHLLPQNRERLQGQQNTLECAARDKGLDPERIRRAHGKLNIRDVCKRFGIEKAYLVDCAFTTAYVHEKNAASSSYVIEKEDDRQFHLGPVGVAGGPITIAIDVLMNMARVLTIAARIVQQESIIQRADEILKKLVSLSGAYGSRPRWPTV